MLEKYKHQAFLFMDYSIMQKSKNLNEKTKSTKNIILAPISQPCYKKREYFKKLLSFYTYLYFILYKQIALKHNYIGELSYIFPLK